MQGERCGVTVISLPEIGGATAAVMVVRLVANLPGPLGADVPLQEALCPATFFHTKKPNDSDSS
jgi:hypothetical protein